MRLVIDTAFALSVALLDGDRVVAVVERGETRGQAETVVAAVATVVGARGDAVRDIVVAVGPGSFTGVRIGIAAARALGLAWGVPVAGVGSLALLAAGAFAARPDVARLVAVVDAGRGQVYWQRFTRDGVTALTDPAAAAPASLAFTAGMLLVGSGAGLVAGDHRLAAVPQARDARLLLPTAFGAARPLYLRAPDAVAA